MSVERESECVLGITTFSFPQNFPTLWRLFVHSMGNEWEYTRADYQSHGMSLWWGWSHVSPDLTFSFGSTMEKYRCAFYFWWWVSGRCTLSMANVTSNIWQTLLCFDLQISVQIGQKHNVFWLQPNSNIPSQCPSAFHSWLNCYFLFLWNRYVKDIVATTEFNRGVPHLIKYHADHRRRWALLDIPGPWSPFPGCAWGAVDGIGFRVPVC